MDLKGSKTEANLMTAFSGECMARVKYEFYAEKVRTAGYEEYGNVIDEISGNEKEHAEIWFRMLGGSDTTVSEALSDAEEGETYEYEEMYQRFARTAEEEGFSEIAKMFERVAAIEKRHAAMYRDMQARINSDTVFKRTRPVKWVCLVCGNVVEGTEPPEICPVCGHTKAYRKEECRNI